MKHLHTFACPVFALQNELASGNTLLKWSPRSRLGLNLGQLPNHARNVYLVLNLTTGLVSPQFHVKFDDLFETTRYAQLDSGAFSAWKQRAGLRRANNTPSPANDGITGSVQQEVQLQSAHPVPTIPEDDTLLVPADEGAHKFESNNDVEHGIPTALDASTQPNPCVEPAVQSPVQPTTTVSSSGRTRKPSRRMVESTQQQSFHDKDGYYTANSATSERTISPEAASGRHELHQE